MMPGAGTFTDPPSVPPDAGRVVAILDGARDVGARIEDRITDAFLDKALPAAGLADELAGRLNGAVGVMLDRVGERIGKKAVKVSRKAAEKLYGAYSYGQKVLPGFPTMEQVAYGNATGDYIGSMGFLPTGDFAPQTAIGATPGPLAADTDLKTPDAPTGGGFSPVPTYPPPPVDSPTRPPSSTPPPSSPVGRFFPTAIGPGGPCRPITSGIGNQIPSAALVGWDPNNPLSAPDPNYHDCWTYDTPTPPGLNVICNCIDACHFGYPEGSAVVRICHLFGERPYISPTGQLQAIPDMIGTPPDEDWVSPVMVGCDSAQVIETPVKPSDQGGTPPGQQPPGGVCCPPEKVPEVCPKPGKLDCGPEMVFPGVQIKDLGTDVCKQLEAGVEALKDAKPVLTGLLNMSVGPVGIGTLALQNLQAITGSSFPALPDLIRRLGGWLEGIVKDVVKGQDCDRAALLPVALTQAGLRFIDQWFGVIPPQATEGVRQISNFICQSLLPTIPQANAAWLAKEINDEEWKCWVAAQGGYIQPQEKVRDAARTRPDAFQLARLLRRKKIDPADYMEAVRQQGVSDQADGSRIFDLTAAWPGLEDTIRMMVRDVADPDAIALGGLDEDFEKKWQGKLKELGEGNGVDEELAKLYWRAHWRLPSFTQLSEMLHRLRPGRVPEAEAVTAKMVEDTLKQDDMAPAWVKRLMAVSYRTVNRTDAVKMYSLRAIDNQQLKDYVQDEGFVERDADNLVGFFETNRRVQEVRRSGLPPPRALVTRYAKGLLSRQEFERIIGLITISDEQANAMKEAGELEKRVLHRTRILAATKKALMRGVLDESDAHAQLASADIEPGEAAELVADWMEEREAAGKLATTAKLCQWRTMGILTATEHEKALERLNWSPFQIERITAECEIQEYERQKKLAEAALAKQKAAADKKEKERLACLPKDEACRQKGYPTGNGTSRKKSSA